MVFNYILFGCPWVLYFTSSNSKINDKFNTNIRLTDTFESSNKLVKVFYGSKESSTPLQPFLPWGFANFEPFTCLPQVNNVYNNIILQIEYFQDFKRPKIAPCLENDTRSGKPRVCILPMVPCCHHRSVAFRVRASAKYEAPEEKAGSRLLLLISRPGAFDFGYDLVHFTGQ